MIYAYLILTSQKSEENTSTAVRLEAHWIRGPAPPRSLEGRRRNRHFLIALLVIYIVIYKIPSNIRIFLGIFG